MTQFKAFGRGAGCRMWLGGVAVAWAGEAARRCRERVVHLARRQGSGKVARGLPGDVVGRWRSRPLQSGVPVRPGGAGGRCGVANGSLGTSEVPNESFATLVEPLSPDQECRLDFAGALSPDVMNDPFMTCRMRAARAQPAAAVRARQPRAFSRFPHTRIEHHV